MKQLLKVLLVAVMTVSLVACGAKKTENVLTVEELISKIGEVTLESKTTISSVELMYNALTDEEKKTVSNKSVLEKAKSTYDDLCVNKVVDLIDGIGTVTLDKLSKIQNARTEYDSLSSELKGKVPAEKVSTLKQAETAIKPLKQKTLNEKLSVLSKEVDKFQGVTFYFPKSLPKYINTRCYVLPYLGIQNNGYAYLILRYNYTGDEWVFWEKITIMVDGQKYYQTASSFDIDRDNDSGDVWECYDEVEIPANDIEMLRAIVKSKETVIRFEGDHKVHDFKVSSKDKTAIKQILAAYDIAK